MIVLENDRLCVEMWEPDKARAHTRRFDSTGYISSVCLDKKHTFCTEEPTDLPHPCTGGMGLSSEIIALGQLWRELEPGEKFPKFGIGLLTKPDSSPYKFFTRYETDPFDIEYTQEGASVTFTVSPKPCMGYALCEKKTVSLEGNSIKVDYTFKNVGEKVLELDEYSHNFISIDKLPISEGYTISLPTVAPQDDKKSTNENGTIFGKGSGFAFTGYCGEPAMMFVEGEEIDGSKPFSWTVANSETPASVTEETSFIPSRIPIWVIDRIISTEVYAHFALEPGEEYSYWRRWTFND